MSSSALNALAIFALLLLTFAAYSNSFSGQIEGDAAALVALDARVHEATPANAHRIVTETYWSSIVPANLYRPLVTFSWMFNYSVLGNKGRAFGYHVFNLAWHSINVLLVWLLVSRLWGNRMGSFLSAAVFAIHPVNTEAVTNIAGRADLMAATGVLVGLLLHIKLPQDLVWKRTLLYLGIALASAFGFLSKENALALPGILLLYDLVFRTERPFWRRLLWPSYLAVLAPVVPVLLWRHFGLGGITDFIPAVDNPLVTTGFWTGRFTAFQILWSNIGLLAWPRYLSWDYSYNQIPFAGAVAGIAGGIGLLFIIGALVFLHRRAAVLAFFGLFFFVTLTPTANIFVLIGAIRADRFLYLPSAGFAVCAVAAAWAIARRVAPSSAPMVLAALFSTVFGLAVTRTHERNSEWTDGPKLWAADVLVSPNSFKTHMAIVNANFRPDMSADTWEESVEHARRAADIAATLPPQLSTEIPLEMLGRLYKLKGDRLSHEQSGPINSLANLDAPPVVESPEGAYKKALEIFTSAAIVDRAGSEFLQSKALENGVPRARIRIVGSRQLYSEIIGLDRYLGRFPSALHALQRLSAMAPTDPTVYDQMAQMQRAMGFPGEAIINWWKAEDLSPNDIYEGELEKNYRALGAGACAVTGGKLNQHCPLVIEHTCEAEAELAAREAQSGLPDESAKLLETARKQGCSGIPLRAEMSD